MNRLIFILEKCSLENIWYKINILSSLASLNLFHESFLFIINVCGKEITWVTVIPVVWWVQAIIYWSFEGRSLMKHSWNNRSFYLLYNYFIKIFFCWYAIFSIILQQIPWFSHHLKVISFFNAKNKLNSFEKKWNTFVNYFLQWIIWQRKKKFYSFIL